MTKQRIGLVLGPALFAVVLWGMPAETMPAASRAVLACTLWIAAWWITEPVPIPVTSLLPIVLFPITGGLAIGQTTASYGQPLIYLFIGGFIIAKAIERWELHRRIAMNIVRLMGTRADHIVLGFMVATWFLSMWIANTATAMMMMPIGAAVITHARRIHGLAPDVPRRDGFGKALMLAIAYAASIGGLASLIGTPTNLVLAGVVRELFEVDISFARWFLFGLPLSASLLAGCWYYLVHTAFPIAGTQLEGGREVVREELAALGPMTREEKVVSLVFALTAVAWITRPFLLGRLLPGVDDTVIALLGASSLFLLPSARARDGRLLNWETAVHLPWGIVILFGGGLALAAGFQESGLAAWFGDALRLLHGLPLLLILVLLVGVVNFLTEVTSNVATASMVMPILAALALAMGVHPFALMVAAALAASCAFMLPVATPPNAVVFGSGYVDMADMVRVGFWMNILSILLVTAFVYFILPLVWNIDLTIYPADLR